MILGRIRNVSYQLQDHYLLKNINATIPEGACIAIVGINGAGKSTLLKILSGKLQPTNGVIDWTGKRPTIAYLKQTEQRKQQSTHLTTDEEFLLSKWKMNKPLASDHPSGGEQMKIRLAKVLSAQSNLFLLDEPSNHLDQESLQSLIETIHQGKGTYIIVSHDRSFIDQTADYVYEMDDGQLTVYKGNYTDYRKKKAHAKAIQAAHYEQQQQKIKQTEKHIAQLDAWAEKAHQAKDADKVYSRMKAKKKHIQIRSKQKRLEAALAKDKIEKPKREHIVNFDVQVNEKKGKRVLEVQDLGKRYGKKYIFQNSSFSIQSGERIALVGPNGCGKSSFFKMVLGETTYDGDLWVTEGMKIGYMSQTLVDLPLDITLSAYFPSETFAEQGHVRTLLKHLGINDKQWKLPLGSLSEGERVKVKLMEFILNGTNVLLLDEPTNHLDLPSREALEDTLFSFPGTLIFASHDTYFTEKLAEGLLIFTNKQIQKVPMTWSEWHNRVKSPPTKKNAEVERMRIEMEQQVILGKLAAHVPGTSAYEKLDQTYQNLTKQLQNLT